MRMHEAGLILEIVPPSKMTTAKYQDRVLDKLAGALAGLDRVTHLNIPEILDENRLGEPFYKNIDALRFGLALRERTGKEILLNKVVVHFDGVDAFRAWLRETAGPRGVKGLILVGGNLSGMNYPGPAVLEANRAAREMGGITIGNILIPSRSEEARRMLEKTRAGAEFFTTQLLFEPDHIKRTLAEYDRLCASARIAPARVFLSFAPLAKRSELAFVKWLGSVVPGETERGLFSESGKTLEKSIALASGIWEEVVHFARARSLRCPLGLNVEEIFLHNLEACLDLAEELETADTSLPAEGEGGTLRTA